MLGATCIRENGKTPIDLNGSRAGSDTEALSLGKQKIQRKLLIRSIYDDCGAWESFGCGASEVKWCTVQAGFSEVNQCSAPHGS